MDLYFFILGFVSYFGKLSFLERVELITVIYGFVFGAIGMFAIPIIFNFIIYPKVERRLGIKLRNWGAAIEAQLFGRFFFSPSLFSVYVLRQYFMLKFSKKFDFVLKKWNDKKKWRNDLTKGNYDIRNASKFEVFMSFFTVIYILLLIIDMLVFWIVHTAK